MSAHVISKSMRDYGPAESFAGLSYQKVIIWELIKKNGVICSLGQKKKKEEEKNLTCLHLSCCRRQFMGGKVEQKPENACKWI